MRRIYTCFPGGKYKAVTLSYDDGKTADRRLVRMFNEAGIKASFHLNSSFLGETCGHRFPYVEPDEVSALYRGHEIASHTCTHPTLTRIPPESRIREILADRSSLEQYAGYPVRGFSYPNGVYDKELSGLLSACGVAYARTTRDTGRFDLPEDFLVWNPTCHHNNQLLSRTREFLEKDYDQRLMLLYVWGHSYEFERDDNWELIEEFCREAGRRDNVWYATGIEIYDYLQAARNLIYFADGRGVYNPGSKSVWLRVDQEIVEVPGGQTLFFEETALQKDSQINLQPETPGQAMRRAQYYLDSDRFLLYRPAPLPKDRGQLDSSLKAWREARPPKTEGNPYFVFGEPVGDMRDNMDQPSKNISQGVSIRSCQMNGVPVRICEPEQENASNASTGSRPCILYIHGGSFVGGSAAAFDNVCSYLSQASGGLVINIDYRLAPETAFPDNIEDCLKVLQHVRSCDTLSFDRTRIYLAGDSAGGNLALACAQKDYEVEGKKQLKGVILYYPVTDLSGTEQGWKWRLSDYQGFQQPMESHCAQSLRGFEPLIEKLYVQGGAGLSSPLVSPLRTPDFQVYPDMLVVSAEYDYLRPQVEAFARKAAENGCRVRAVRYGGMNHAFVSLTGIVCQAQDALDEAADFIKNAYP